MTESLEELMGVKLTAAARRQEELRRVAEHRERVKRSLALLRAERRCRRECRECGRPLDPEDVTRCLGCKAEHAARERRRVLERAKRARVLKGV